MRLTTFYISLAFGAFVLLSSTMTMGAGISGGKAPELERQSSYSGVPVLTNKTGQGLPFSKHGSKQGKCFSASDAITHLSVTGTTSPTFAIVIALVKNDEHDLPTRVLFVPELSVFHKVLFSSIISPNAP